MGRKQDQATPALTKKFKPYSRVPKSNPNFNSNLSQWKKGDNVGGNGVKTTFQNSKAPFKILTSFEMAARREKSLCYNCDESFSYGHKCKQRINYMIMAEEEEELPNSGSYSLDSEEKIVYGADIVEEVQMSLNALAGEDGSLP